MDGWINAPCYVPCISIICSFIDYLQIPPIYSLFYMFVSIVMHLFLAAAHFPLHFFEAQEPNPLFQEEIGFNYCGIFQERNTCDI